MKKTKRKDKRNLAQKAADKVVDVADLSTNGRISKKRKWY